ncbi:MAG: DUF4340 domain-containing protein [Stellaceae bacterium]
MRRTGLFTLYGVTIAAVIAAVVLSIGGGRAGTNPLVDRPVLTDLASHLATVARLTVVHGDNKTTLLRQHGVWVVGQKDDYPADQKKMKRILLGLAALRYGEPKTANPKLYSRLDVEDAGKKGSDSRLLTLSDAKGRLMDELIVGKRRYGIFGNGNDGIYVRKPGQKQSWLAKGSVELPIESLGWINRTISMIPLHRIKSARFIAPDGKISVYISRDKKGAKFILAGGIPKGKKLKDADALNELGRTLDYFSLNDVKPAKDLPFPANKTYRAIYTTFNGLTVSATMIEHDEITKDDNGNSTDTKKYWVKLHATGHGKAAAKEAASLDHRVDAWTYAVPKYKAADFKATLAGLFAHAKKSS